MSLEEVGTEELVRRAGRDDGPARDALFDRHRKRLRRMVASVLDRRLSARVDPSDVVQEALADADHRLPEYLRAPTAGYYPWLRRLTLQRLVWWHRFHVRSRKRSVSLEWTQRASGGDPPTVTAADLLADTGTSPSEHAVRNEETANVQAALRGLPPADREVLELRYVEGIPFGEIAVRLGIGLSAVKMRHLRSIGRLARLLDDSQGRLPHD